MSYLTQMEKFSPAVATGVKYFSAAAMYAVAWNVRRKHALDFWQPRTELTVFSLLSLFPFDLFQKKFDASPFFLLSNLVDLFSFPILSLDTVMLEWHEGLGDGPFHGGDTPDLADLSVYGALRSTVSLRYVTRVAPFVLSFPICSLSSRLSFFLLLTGHTRT